MDAPQQRQQSRAMKGAPAALADWRFPLVDEATDAACVAPSGEQSQANSLIQNLTSRVPDDYASSGTENEDGSIAKVGPEVNPKRSRSKPKPIDTQRANCTQMNFKAGDGRSTSNSYHTPSVTVRGSQYEGDKSCPQSLLTPTYQYGNASRTSLVMIEESDSPPSMPAIPRDHIPATPIRAAMPTSPRHSRNSCSRSTVSTSTRASRRRVASPQAVLAQVPGYTPTTDRPQTFEAFRPYQSNATRNSFVTNLVTAPGNLCDKTSAAATQSILMSSPTPRTKNGPPEGVRHRRKWSKAEKVMVIFKSKKKD